MKRDLKDQVYYQEMEILFSHDFDKMTLEQLKEINTQYLSVHSQAENLS